jgi:hypothetical protein
MDLFTTCMLETCDPHTFNIDVFINECTLRKISLQIAAIKIIKIMSKIYSDDQILKLFQSNSQLSTIQQPEELIAIHKPLTLYQSTSETYLTQRKVDDRLNIDNKIFTPTINLKVHATVPDPIFDNNGLFVSPPKLNYLQCLHRNCKTVFSSVNNLVMHLQKNKKYNRGWHRQHTQVYSLMRDEIINKEITKCDVCRFNGNTYNDLLDHLCSLGIPAYCNNKEEYDAAYNRLYSKPIVENLDVFSTNECVFCYNEKPQTLLLPCNHNLFCIKCIVKIPQCPMCATVIDYIIPF